MRLLRAWALLLLVACSANGTATQPSVSPTGRYDPNAPRGGGTYTSADGKLAFAYPQPWYVAANDADGVSLVNFTLTLAEQDRRQAADIYGYGDGEGNLLLATGPAQRSLAKIRADECKLGGGTTKVRECTTIRVNGRTADWMLIDHENDSSCTCRIMVIVAGGTEYSFSGGACVGCKQTPRILREVEQILRSVVIKG